MEGEGEFGEASVGGGKEELEEIGGIGLGNGNGLIATGVRVRKWACVE